MSIARPLPDPPVRPHDDSEATTLETLVRDFRGERTELRVDRARFNGSRPFTRVQIWAHGHNGVFPTRRVITVRDGELERVIAALQRSRDLAATEPSTPTEGRRR